MWKFLLRKSVKCILGNFQIESFHVISKFPKRPSFSDGFMIMRVIDSENSAAQPRVESLHLL